MDRRRRDRPPPPTWPPAQCRSFPPPHSGVTAMNSMRLQSAIALVLCLGFGVVSVSEAGTVRQLSDKNVNMKPTGNGKPTGGNGIDYHGGPVILGTTNVYYIWYGNWNGNSAPNILTELAQNMGGSRYFNINTTYYNGSNQHVT